MGIFHAYDVRGLYPEEINTAIVKKIGAALIECTHAQEVVVGYDMRPSSLVLFPALCEGIASHGAHIIDIGVCSTPLFYFSVVQSKGAAGVMITASHNPAQYNGLKLLNTDAAPIGETSGIRDIEKIASQPSLSHTMSSVIPHMVKKNFLEMYIARLTSLVAPEEVSGLRVVIDAGNGMGGFVAPPLFRLLPCAMHPLYFELDGTFPHHEANPIHYETLRDLTQVVKETQAHLGVAFDGDADRIGFVDEQGEVVPGDIVTALLAQELLRDHKGGLVLCDVRSSRSVGEVVNEAGGTWRYTRVGHALIKKHMKESGALFAGELSGHYYFNEFNRNEAPEYALLLIMRILAREKQPLSKLVAHVKRYAHSGEINFEVSNKIDTIVYIKDHYQNAISVNETDGLRVDFPDWWFNVRASNTEPKLRLNVEAATEDVMRKKTQELTTIISRFVTG